MSVDKIQKEHVEKAITEFFRKYKGNAARFYKENKLSPPRTTWVRVRDAKGREAKLGAKALLRYAAQFTKSKKIATGNELYGGIPSIERLRALGLTEFFHPSISPFEGSDEPEPKDNSDALEWINVSIRRRRGQTEFRKALISAYDRKCVVSQVSVLDVLEAAHIKEFSKKGQNVVTNGLLLRSDLHVLFDINKMGIDPDKLTVHFSNEIRALEPYKSMEGQIILRPKNRKDSPEVPALKDRWKKFRENYKQN